jgi:hypothetical protein
MTKFGAAARSRSGPLGYDRSMRADDGSRARWTVVESTRVFRPMGTQS